MQLLHDADASVPAGRTDDEWRFTSDVLALRRRMLASLFRLCWGMVHADRGERQWNVMRDAAATEADLFSKAASLDDYRQRCGQTMLQLTDQAKESGN